MSGDETEEMYVREVYRPSRRGIFTHTFKRVAFISVLTVAAVSMLVLVAVSPLALRQIGSIRGVNWVQLSNIGQTYGAASALLTGLALIGVAGSMVFQVRAIEVSRWDSSREKHVHLMEMALKDPVYMRAWGLDPEALGGSDRGRQLLYINLIISYWEDQYRLGSVQENALRGDLAILFRGEAGREFWAIGRYARLRTSHSRRVRRFSSIVEEEYQKALAAGPPIIKAEERTMIASTNRQLPWHGAATKGGAALFLAAVGGIVFRTILHRRKR